MTIKNKLEKGLLAVGLVGALSGIGGMSYGWSKYPHTPQEVITHREILHDLDHVTTEELLDNPQLYKRVSECYQGFTSNPARMDIVNDYRETQKNIAKSMVPLFLSIFPLGYGLGLRDSRKKQEKQ
jgi:hypothetical protein